MCDEAYINNPGPKVPVTDLKAATSTDSEIVTETILKVLKSGGTAADAGIAGCMVQAAVESFMTNHTGTVTFLYYEAATGQIHQLDSAGTFPSGLAPFKPVPPGTGTYAAIPPSGCIPGFMPGLKAIHERFGTKPWAELCEDAIRWADEGHPVSTFEYGVNIWGQDFITYFPEGRAFYMPNGFFANVGERFGSKAMAATLRKVAEEGPDWMITGGWADAFIAKANEMGWAITKEHMTETPPRWLEPLRFDHQEYEIVSLGPPQLQGVFCAVVLGILRQLGIRDMEPGSADAIYSMAHALRKGQQHWEYVQDPNIHGLPIDELLDPAYHGFMARLIQNSRPTIDLSSHVKLAGPGPGVNVFAALASHGGRPTGGSSEQERPTGSCELAIVDEQGNWVQMMNTLQSGGIPGMVIEGIPMVGSHASFGIPMSPLDARLVEGGRMRSVIGNTMVLSDGKPLISLGSPGNVHCTVPQVLTNLLDFNMEPYTAADAPRMLPLGEDMTITMEDRVSDEAQAGLAALGARLKVTPVYDFHMGSFQMCWRDPGTGTLGATADPRRCGFAQGIPA
jgi:gamma-glutamyltranspeptidase/glutathione hydrolase